MSENAFYVICLYAAVLMTIVIYRRMCHINIGQNDCLEAVSPDEWRTIKQILTELQKKYGDRLRAVDVVRCLEYLVAEDMIISEVRDLTAGEGDTRYVIRLPMFRKKTDWSCADKEEDVPVPSAELELV